jgi:hypothetical protein
MMTPDRDPDAPLYKQYSSSEMSRPFMEHLSLTDGSVLKRYLAPIPNVSVLLNTVGIQESDRPTGTIGMYRGSDGVVQAAAGGDWGWTNSFVDGTGESAAKTAVTRGSNRSGYVVMHNDAPGYFISGGADSHYAWTTGRMGRVSVRAPYFLTPTTCTVQELGGNTVKVNGIVDRTADFVNQLLYITNAAGGATSYYITAYAATTDTFTIHRPVTALSVVGARCYVGVNIAATSVSAQVMKDYGSSLLRGTTAYTYTCWSFRSGGVGFGITARKWDLGVNTSKTPDWTYLPKALERFDDPVQSFSCYGDVHCMGAPRAVCLSDANQFCFFGFKAKGYIGKPGVASDTELMPDTTVPLSLTVLAPNMTRQWSIPTTYKLPGEFLNTYRFLAPQIATRGKYVVVFCPYEVTWGATITPQAKLFCFDVEAGKLAWEYTYPKNQFITKVALSWDAPAQQAVQMCVAGNQVIVAEPYSDTSLKLRVYRHALDTGVISGEDLRYTCQHANGSLVTGVLPAQTALAELAVVDGNLVALTHYRYPNTQVISGYTKKTDPITKIVTTTPIMKTVFGDTGQWLVVIR